MTCTPLALSLSRAACHFSAPCSLCSPQDSFPALDDLALKAPRVLGGNTGWLLSALPNLIRVVNSAASVLEGGAVGNHLHVHPCPIEILESYFARPCPKDAVPVLVPHGARSKNCSLTVANHPPD